MQALSAILKKIILYDRKGKWHIAVRAARWRLMQRSLCEMWRSAPRKTGGDEAMIEEGNISVAMRDGTRLAVDVYRPDKSGKYPVLYAAALAQ